MTTKQGTSSIQQNHNITIKNHGFTSEARSETVGIGRPTIHATENGARSPCASREANGGSNRPRSHGDDPDFIGAHGDDHHDAGDGGAGSGDGNDGDGPRGARSSRIDVGGNMKLGGLHAG